MIEKKNRYGAGLLIAYMAFIPFCEAGIMDGISLQVLDYNLDLSS